MQIQIPERLIPFTQPKRFKVMIGGRGSAKSESTAALHAGMVHQSGCRDVCCREFQNSIKQSVHSLVSRKIREIGMPGFNIMDTEIRHDNGGQIIYQGLSRDPEAIKSVDDAELAWCEEAQSLSHESIEKLTPSIRGKDAEIWFTANLGNSKDAFSQRFIKPFEKHLRRYRYYADDLHMIVWINYEDNPWFPPELEAERAYDKETMSDAEYEHKWEGEYNDSVENAIIAPAWFDACVDAHVKLGIKPQGVEVVSHDPSDTGADSKGIAYRHGIVIKHAEENERGDANEGADWACDYAHTVKPDVFVWDVGGLGVGLRRQILASFEGKHTQVEAFNGAMGVDDPMAIYEGAGGEEDHRTAKTNEESFRNKRAQYYWYLRDRCYRTYRAVVHKEYQDPTTLISFSSDIKVLDALRSEVCRVPLKHNGIGLIQIATKQEMRALGIPSPNMADAIMMSLVTPIFPKRMGPPIRRGGRKRIKRV